LRRVATSAITLERTPFARAPDRSRGVSVALQQNPPHPDQSLHLKLIPTAAKSLGAGGVSETVMDPSMMKTMDYFGQNMDSAGRQNAEASSSTAPPPVTSDASLWDPTLSLGMSDEIATSIPYGQQTTSSSQGVHYGSLAGPQPYATPSVSQAPVAPSIATTRKREGHDRKRAKVDNDAAALESVDYWIHLDDDDLDSKLGGSFEIDFSKRRNDTANYARYVQVIACG